MSRLGRTGTNSAQHRAPRTKLAVMAAEESKIAYTLKDSLLKEIKEALFINLRA